MLLRRYHLGMGRARFQLPFFSEPSYRTRWFVTNLGTSIERHLRKRSRPRASAQL